MLLDDFDKALSNPNLVHYQGETTLIKHYITQKIHEVLEGLKKPSIVGLRPDIERDIDFGYNQRNNEVNDEIDHILKELT